MAGWTALDALRRFESWIAEALESRLGGLLGARIQPVDLAQRLAGAMDDRLAFGAERVYAPNTYRIYLAPVTLAGFASYQRALEDELAAFVAERATERDLALIGRVRVALLADTALRPERARVEADVVDRRALAGGPDGSTMAFEAVAPEALAPAPLDLVHRERAYALPRDDAAAEVRIGRSLDCDLILDNGTVSRVHARVFARAGHWVIEDLGSRAGVVLNGRPVSAAPLRAGDHVRLGAIVLGVAAPSDATVGSDGPDGPEPPASDDAPGERSSIQAGASVGSGGAPRAAGRIP